MRAPGVELSQADDELVAACTACGTAFRSVVEARPEQLVAALRAPHRDDRSHPHRRRPPDGWRTCLSWPVALSQ